MDYPKTPELDKMLAVKEKSRAIGDFLSWLQEQDVHLCRRNPATDMFAIASFKSKELKAAEKLMGSRGPGATSIEGILAVYFGINLDEMEKERRALLDYTQRMQGNG